jgi:hypothetical protein
MKKSKMAFIVLALITFSELTTHGAVTYSKDYVADSVVQEILSEEFNAKLNDTKDTIVVNSGIKILVERDSDRSFIRISGAFKSPEDMSRTEKLNICQRYNDKTIFVRFSIDNDGDFYLDYFLPYNGGLDSKNLQKSVQWFFSVAEDFKDNILK